MIRHMYITSASKNSISLGDESTGSLQTEVIANSEYYLIHISEDN